MKQTSFETVHDVHQREFDNLESAQRAAIANVKDLVCDALLVGKSPDIQIEIWEESGGVVSVVQGSVPDDAAAVTV